MSMNEKLHQTMNSQIIAEFESALVYMQLSYELDRLSFPGMSSWMSNQSDEERFHASKFADHMLARDVRVQLSDVPVTPTTISTPLEAFEIALKHERKISEMIRELARIADSVEDYDSRSLINWFLDEQIEEEDTVSRIVDQIRLVGDDGSGLLRIDAQLSTAHPRNDGNR
ncbi:ferritin [Corynebacterium halotolerans]|nr:ferritin [Corynebacterium halotolerans]